MTNRQGTTAEIRHQGRRSLRVLAGWTALVAAALVAAPAVAGADVAARINFQPGAAIVPLGYTADSGAAFDAARGFGWVREDSLKKASHVALDMSPNAVERDLHLDQRLDTFIQTDFARGTTPPPGAVTIPGSWEMTVPSGMYEVVVSVGDPGPDLNSSHRIAIEGQSAITGFIPTSTTKFATATRIVTVSDGRLTIDARNGRNTKIDYVDVTTYTPPDTTAPPAPSGVTATPGDAMVTLNWNAVTAADLAGYDVFRSTSVPVGTAAGTQLNGSTPLTTTTFTDLAVTNNTKYYYVVTASDTTGNRSPASATVSATPNDGSAPPPTERHINFQPVAAPVPSGYTADAGAPYSAVAGEGWVREDSIDSASPVPLDVGPNARDRNVTSNQLLDTFIHMQYPPLNAPPSAVTTPAAWIMAVPDGYYTVVVSVGDAAAEFDSSHQINVEDQPVIAGFVPASATRHASGTRTVFVDDGFLTIDARGGTNTKIDYVDIVSAGADTTPPVAPANVSAQAGDSRVELSWSPNSESDLAGYDVFRSTSLPVSTAGTPLNGSTLLTGVGYTDTTAVNGTTYHYVVVAQDASENRSGPSSPVSATPQSAPPPMSRAINFQPAASTVPAGFTADSGAAYSSTTGQGWVREDSLDSTHVALSVSGNARERNTAVAQELDTFMHMQYPAAGAPAGVVTTPAAFELAVANGGYAVTVAVGDAGTPIDSVNRINIEGQVAITGFRPTAADKFMTATRTVNVTDGRLTIDARGGSNTKLAYVKVVSDSTLGRPSVTSLSPVDAETDVPRDASVTAEVRLPNVGAGVDPATLTSSTVRLVRNVDGVAVPANRNTTGGGDAIVLQPTVLLDATTTYRVEITSGVKDLSGAAFLPYTSFFTAGTGKLGGTGPIDAQFTKVALPTAQGQSFTSLTMGPDNKLYAATLDGFIYRFTLNADGTAGTPQIISSVRTANGGPRTILGLAFDPVSTSTNLILWISHNEYAFSDATDWTGEVTRLTGADLQTVQDFVVGLPRSVRDHESNSLAFGPDGALYLTQGSNTATGAADSQWGLRPEHVLNAAVLRIDKTAIGSPPLNVKSEEGGTYDPFAPGVAVTIYASGLRNSFDLVWHSNGQLYVPTNGSAAGGNTPASPSPLPASCSKRIDAAVNGAYTGPAVPGLANLSTAQPDYLNRVVKGGYYGHPNPTRCEWALNGANPTSGVDPAEVAQYGVGVQPDRNFRRPAYSFGIHYSPDGVIEYRSPNFGGALRGKLLVTRYSAGDDVIALTPGTTNLDSATGQTGIPGLTGFVDPLDIVEDRRNGNLYVTELGASRITLVRPVEGAGTPAMTTSPSRLIYNDVQGGAASAAKSVTIHNDGNAPLSVSGLAIGGTHASQFQLQSAPALPATVAAGGTLAVQVVFNPTSTGPKEATLTVSGDDTANAQDTIELRGLGTLGLGGANEPSLQWILDTYDIPVNAGDPDPSTSALPTDAIIGEEVALQQLAKAGTGSVTIEPLAVFGPQSAGGEVTDLGWYPVATGARTELFSVANAAYQSLDPATTGSLSFDPGSSTFGMSTIWPFFSGRQVFTEDVRNTFTGALPHQVRAYPLKTSAGSVVANSYVIAFEESTSGHDFQDLVFIVHNVRPASSSSAGRIEVANLDLVPYADRMAFSRIGSLASPPSNGVHDRATLRISNTGGGPLTISALTLSGPWTLLTPPALPATIPAGGSLNVTVRFVAETGTTHSGTLTIASNDPATPSQVVQLAGWWQSVSEGGKEPPLATIVSTVMSYKTTFAYSGQTLNRQGRVETAGEEVLSAFWSRVDTTKPITVRQLAAFHTQGNTATIRWHARGSTTLNTIFTHAGIDGQSLLPRLNGSTTAPAAGSFSPTGVFGFKIDTEWSDDVLNVQTADLDNGCPGPCGHHVRFWPARDRAGARIADAWIVAMDYNGINYDYNDNVYFVTNMKPEWSGPVLQRRDVGATANYTDSIGSVWTPDSGLFTPATAPNEGANTLPLEIDRTIDDPIYRTYRGNVGAVPQDQRILSYALPTGAATRVDLRLHFAERASGNNAAGERLQDISAEGVLLRDNFDIWAATGGLNRAYQLAFNNIAVSGGALNLTFKADVDYPSIAGIEVLCRTGC